MRVPTNMNAHVARPVASGQKECDAQIETALRIRPLSRRERDDAVLLEALKGSGSNGTELALLKSPGNDHDHKEYQFNHVLPESTSQEKIYYTLGLPIVTAAMNSLKNSSSTRKQKSHLLISMGVENSGKTFTSIGGTTISKKRATQDGLVPRLLDGLFSQSSHAGSGSRGFTVQVSIMEITESDEIHDLLIDSSTSKNKLFSPKVKKNLNVRNIAARFERAIPSPVSRKLQKTPEGGSVLDAKNPRPTVRNCNCVSEAREILQNAISSQKSEKGSFFVTMQPALVDGTKIGDKICVLDTAGLEMDNEQIMNCLKTLKHNGSSRKSPKQVPFRNSKATMMLNPLFLQSSSVNITLLLTAYPGYTDFQEKQILLNSIEKLTRGARFENTTKVNVLSRPHKKSEVYDRRASHRDEKRDQDHGNHSATVSRDPKVSAQRLSVATKATKASKRDNPPTESIQIPKVSDSVLSNDRRMSTEKEQNSLEEFPSYGIKQNVEPSAPVFEEVQEYSAQSMKLRERAIDFPGVESTAPMEESPVELANHSARQSYPHERRLTRNLQEARKVETRAPLRRSSLENHDHVSRNKEAKVVGTRQRTRGDKDRTSTASKAGNTENENYHRSQEEVKKLEEKLKKALQENEALQKTCSQLKNENAELKQLAREAGRNTSRHTMTAKEEEDFQSKRKMRLEAQNRIKAPVQEHLDRVNYFYDIRNQWCMTNKKHFSLSFPDHFQRAPDLDVRDREIENAEDLNKLSRNDTIRSELTESSGIATPPRQMSPQKVTRSRSPPPAGLSALRKLVGTTLKD